LKKRRNKICVLNLFHLSLHQQIKQTMATKTFKSEYHAGGSIKVTTDEKKKQVTFLVCDHEYVFNTTDSRAESQMDNFLFENTSSYYAEQILNWVKSKIKIETPSFW